MAMEISTANEKLLYDGIDFSDIQHIDLDYSRSGKWLATPKGSIHTSTPPPLRTLTILR